VYVCGEEREGCRLMVGREWCDKCNRELERVEVV